MELPYNPVIPLLEMKSMSQRDICSPMFTAALFTIAKTHKQPKHPLPDEWIKMWYIYTMEYYPTIKKKEIKPFG